MEFLIVAFGVPMIIFMMFVAPVWVIMHYRSKRQLNQGLSEADVQHLEVLMHKAESMQERLTTLESILDAEVPDWRSKN